MREILADKLGSNVKSIDVDDGKVQIRVPNSFLNKATEENYGRKIESVSVEDSEVKVNLSTPSTRGREDGWGESFNE